jgi:hypothetical protein
LRPGRGSWGQVRVDLLASSWRWPTAMGGPAAPSRGLVRADMSVGLARWLANSVEAGGSRRGAKQEPPAPCTPSHPGGFKQERLRSSTGSRGAYHHRRHLGRTPHPDVVLQLGVRLARARGRRPTRQRGRRGHVRRSGSAPRRPCAPNAGAPAAPARADIQGPGPRLQGLPHSGLAPYDRPPVRRHDPAVKDNHGRPEDGRSTASSVGVPATMEDTMRAFRIWCRLVWPCRASVPAAAGRAR